jgi:hypothetical protein
VLAYGQADAAAGLPTATEGLVRSACGRVGAAAYPALWLLRRSELAVAGGGPGGGAVARRYNVDRWLERCYHVFASVRVTVEEG